MLKYGNREFRNLQEQVDKNMNDILWLINYKGALNEFGIKVVGQGPFFPDGLPNASEYTPGDVIAAEVDSELGVYICTEIDEDNDWTQDIEIYKEDHTDWAYGDAWIFGDEAPYEMFILTRSNAAEPEDYFLPVGQFPIPGPQGEQGVQGPIGDTPNIAMNIGSVSTLNPDQSATASISKSGTLAEPVFTINLALPQGAKGNTGSTGPQGPQGPQGPKGETGEKGEQGGLIDVVGIVSDASELPDPEELQKLDAAYLVGEESDYELYIQVGETPATAIWTNLGIMNQGTTVTVGGDPVQVWEADSKVSVYKDGAVSTIYGVSAGGSSSYHLPYGSGLVANGVVLRDANYQVTIPETPTADGHAASKKYVDTTISSKIPLQYQGDIIVAGSGGAASRLAIGSAGQYLKVNSSGNGLEYATLNGVPAYTSADATKALLVNALGTGLEWGTVSGGGGGGSLTNFKSVANTGSVLVGGDNSITGISTTQSGNKAFIFADGTNWGPITFNNGSSASTINCGIIGFTKSNPNSALTNIYVNKYVTSSIIFTSNYGGNSSYNTIPNTECSVVLVPENPATGQLITDNNGKISQSFITLVNGDGECSNYNITNSYLSGYKFITRSSAGIKNSILISGLTDGGTYSYMKAYDVSSSLILNSIVPDRNKTGSSIKARLADCLLIGSNNAINYLNTFTPSDASPTIRGVTLLGYNNTIYAGRSSIDGITICGAKGSFTCDSNATDLFLVGANKSDRTFCFTAGNDGTDDYIKVGDTKLTETQLIALLATL